MLVGISNGGRVARAIDAELGKSNHLNIKKIHFVSVVGACKGSSLADLAHTCGLSWLRAEMHTYSTRNTKLNYDWAKAIVSDRPTRKYTFIASPHDK